MFPTDWFHHPNVFDSRATTTDALLPPRYVHFVIERPTGSFPICWARAIGLVQRHVSVEGKRQERIERPEPNCHWSKLVRSLTFRTQTKFKSERKFWHTLACCCTYHRRDTFWNSINCSYQQFVCIDSKPTKSLDETISQLATRNDKEFSVFETTIESWCLDWWYGRNIIHSSSFVPLSQNNRTMKGLFTFTLRHFYATIIALVVVFFHNSVEVQGFQNTRISNVQSRIDSFSDNFSMQKSLPSTLPFPSNHKNRMSRTILAMAGVPTLDKWKIISSGSVIGTVKNHPAIADGDVITTSPIQDPQNAARQAIVTTMSGSKYKLLEPRGEISAAAKRKEAQALAAAMAAADQAADQAEQEASQEPPAPKSQPSPPSFFGGWGGAFQKANGSNSSSSNANNNVVSEDTSDDRRKEILRSSPQWQEAVQKYMLNGETIGLEDEYLLANKPERSTSGKSNIWEAYKADEATGLPVENATPVCLKISTNLEAISREYENYRKLSFLGFWETGRFVRCYEFFPVAGYATKYRNQCALAIEKGSRDLKTFLTSKGKLEKKELRDACTSATQCVQALHNAGLVWTDMKTENFVVMDNGDVKGIDLESAMPIGDYPVDYSPEACPPEFATAFLQGDGPYFELDASYDIWSLGMLMLELSTGNGYFDGRTPAMITKQLRDMDDASMVRDLDTYDIPDDKLKDLIKRCLRRDPAKRPNTSQILMHPYFLAGNPFSFLSIN